MLYCIGGGGYRFPGFHARMDSGICRFLGVNVALRVLPLPLINHKGGGPVKLSMTSKVIYGLVYRFLFADQG